MSARSPSAAVVLHVTGDLFMILLVDNYDSFTYNLVQRLGEIDPELSQLRVVRNDQVTLDEIEAMLAPTHPYHFAWTMYALFRLESPTTSSCEFLKHDPSIGGVPGTSMHRPCAGARRVVRTSGRIMHGKDFAHSPRRPRRVPRPPVLLEATRYRSLVIEPGSLPEDLEVVAWTDQEEIMGVRHKHIRWKGSSFIPRVS